MTNPLVAFNYWVSTHLPNPSKIWYPSFWYQMNLLSGPIFNAFSYDAKQVDVSVISEHVSKSIVLPVCLFRRPGLSIIMGSNFHDWTISVESDNASPCDFSEVFQTSPPEDLEDTILDQTYFKGFDEDWIYGYADENRRRFSAILRNYEMNDDIVSVVSVLSGLTDTIPDYPY